MPDDDRSLSNQSKLSVSYQQFGCRVNTDGDVELDYCSCEEFDPGELSECPADKNGGCLIAKLAYGDVTETIRGMDLMSLSMQVEPVTRPAYQTRGS